MAKTEQQILEIIDSTLNGDFLRDGPNSGIKKTIIPDAAILEARNVALSIVNHENYEALVAISDLLYLDMIFPLGSKVRADIYNRIAQENLERETQPDTEAA